MTVNSRPAHTAAPDDTKLTVSVEAAARMLGISRSTAYRAANAGELPVLRFGRRIRVPVDALSQMCQLNSGGAA